MQYNIHSEKIGNIVIDENIFTSSFRILINKEEITKADRKNYEYESHKIRIDGNMFKGVFLIIDEEEKILFKEKIPWLK